MRLNYLLTDYKSTSFFCLIMGLSVLMIHLYDRPDEQELKLDIEVRLEAEIQKQSEYINEVTKDPKLINSFGNKPQIYPTFLFDNQKIVAWNTSKINIQFRKLVRLDTFGVTDIHQCKYLYKKRYISDRGRRYILVSLIPLIIDYEISNQYLNQGYNQNIFTDQIQLVNPQIPGVIPITVNGRNDLLAFKQRPEASRAYSDGILKSFTLMFIVSLLILVFQFAESLLDKDKWIEGLVIIVSGLIALRTILIMCSFPNLIVEMELFDSSVFKSSDISPSLGDLLLNTFSFLLIVLYIYHSRDKFQKRFRSLGKIKVVFSQLIILSGYIVFLWYASTILEILGNSQIALDINDTINFHGVRPFAYLTVCLAGLIVFVWIHTVYSVVFSGIRTTNREYFGTLIISCILMFCLAMVLKIQYLYVGLSFLFYLSLLYFYQLPLRLSSFKFGSINYVLFGAFILAGVGSYFIFEGESQNELVRKQKYSNSLIIERDIEVEYLLNDIVSRLKSDAVINSKIISPRVSVSQIEDRINQLFLDGEFAGYDIKAKLFNQHGIQIGLRINKEYYSEQRNYVEKNEIKTDYENIFFEGNFASSGRKRYVSFVELERYSNRTGFLILELIQKKQVARSVYPALLVDKPLLNKSNYDYAIFQGKEMVNSVGEFNYRADFDPDWLEETKIYSVGLNKNGYHHWGLKSGPRVIVISSEAYTFWKGLSNFSFLFLCYLILVVFIALLSAPFMSFRQGTINFSTKILIYLAIAFAMPLLLVGGAILSTLNQSYKSEIDKSYQKRTVAISEHFVDIISQFSNHELNRDDVTNELITIGRSSRSDLNLFDRSGLLISSSQPKIIDAGLSAAFINPVALNEIINEDQDQLIVEESIGKLDYKTSYVAIRSFDDGQLLGILSSPFFSSKNHLGRQQTEVFTSIINISTLIFILSIGLSYVAVRRLTNPLVLLAAKLKKTQLEEENEPLEWKGNDEIGVLIKEYNSMLEKLDFSKSELARNQKEAAWREMAKQVAHEIKNPLTPMKLTLQHLDRIMDKEDGSRKSLNTLLNQVETLDQIVTSFSHFAKMPDPENEHFDIIKELQRTIDLHPEKEIDFKSDVESATINADRKLIGRVFNNIILNAFQAMSKTSKALLEIEIATKQEKILIAFKDHGTGISQDIKDKVFTPNFSTKDSGSGIGLAVAKRGIEHTGGLIWFEPNKPQGTIFYIELPLIG